MEKREIVERLRTLRRRAERLIEEAEGLRGAIVELENDILTPKAETEGDGGTPPDDPPP